MIEILFNSARIKLSYPLTTSSRGLPPAARWAACANSPPQGRPACEHTGKELVPSQCPASCSTDVSACMSTSADNKLENQSG